MIAYVIAEHTLTILSTFEQGYRGVHVAILCTELSRGVAE